LATVAHLQGFVVLTTLTAVPAVNPNTDSVVAMLKMLLSLLQQIPLYPALSRVDPQQVLLMPAVQPVQSPMEAHLLTPRMLDLPLARLTDLLKALLPFLMGLLKALLPFLMVLLKALLQFLMGLLHHHKLDRQLHLTLCRPSLLLRLPLLRRPLILKGTA